VSWRWGSQARVAAVVELGCCLMRQLLLWTGQQKESLTIAGGLLLGRSSCLVRRGRGDASAREPDVSPSQQGSAVPLPAQLSAAVAELGSLDAGGLLLLRCAAVAVAGIHWG